MTPDLRIDRVSIIEIIKNKIQAFYLTEEPYTPRKYDQLLVEIARLLNNSDTQQLDEPEAAE